MRWNVGKVSQKRVHTDWHILADLQDKDGYYEKIKISADPLKSTQIADIKIDQRYKCCFILIISVTMATRSSTNIAINFSYVTCRKTFHFCFISALHW